MTYDPAKDEPIITVREMKTLIREAIRYTVRSMRRELLGSSDWKPDSVYYPGERVSHRGEDWIALEETASEPGEGSAMWDRVDFKGE